MSARPAQAFRLSGFTPRRMQSDCGGIHSGIGDAVDGRRPNPPSGLAAAADPAALAPGWPRRSAERYCVRAAGEVPPCWRLPVAATPIAGQSEIATGSDGVAVLDNGVDHIRLTPNSRPRPAGGQGEGLMTVVRQSLGKIFFDIGPRPDRSFEVDAPYLVVLVKGTQFTVSANYLGATASR